MKNLLLNALGAMIRIVGMDKAGEIAMRYLRSALFMIGAGIAALTMAIFFLIALWRFLLPYTGPEGTPLVFALVFLLIAGGLVAASWFTVHPSSTQPLTPGTARVAAVDAPNTRRVLTGGPHIIVLLNAAIGGFLTGLTGRH